MKASLPRIRCRVIIERLTDNINRTVAEIRALFRQAGQNGKIRSGDSRLRPRRHDRDASPEGDAGMAAIEAGAQDFESADDGGTAASPNRLT
jgi:transcriptional/translational regulatory protein YebC/TACO1